MKVPLRSWLRLNPASLTLAVIVPVLVLFVSGAPILDLIELKTYDLRLRSRGTRPVSPAVVIAAIDEKSLDQEGRWPWPRSKIAALVDTLSASGARVIAFDVGFSEPDENSQLALIDQLERRMGTRAAADPALAGFIAESRQRADNDRALAEAIRKSSAAVILGYFFHMSDASLEYRLEPREIERRLGHLTGSKYPVVAYQSPDTAALPLIRGYAPEVNLDVLGEAATASGYFSLQGDSDGVLRWMPLVIQAGDDLFPPLAILCAWHALGKPPLSVKVGHHGVDEIRMGDRVIPTDVSGQLLVNYPGPPKTFTHLSVTDILKGRVTPDAFKGRVVLVGATALGTYDLRNTPVSPLYPGVEVHAAVIDSILTQSFMVRPEWSKLFDVLAVVALASLVGGALPHLSPLRGLAFAGVLFIAYIVAARALFVTAQVWLNMVYPLLALVAAYTVLTAYYYVTEQRQRKKVKEAFQHYVAPVVVEEMLKDPKRLKLGGEVKVLTVLFSDLEGFTTYAERFEPPEMAQMLGEYYNRVTEQVFLHRGTLKEYVGDELMAIFGAPLEHADHAAQACAAALAMRDKRRELATEWKAIGRPQLRARTGINTGPMLVGNLGSRYRFAYGVLGDQVNLGSRLEGLNKVYGTEILIGENTARLVEGAFALREVDMVRVLGRTQAVRIYELIGTRASARTPEQQKAARAYAAGLEAYRQKVWNDALALFAEALAECPDDGPARTLRGRCEAFRQTPPPEEWAGVFDQVFKQ
jgi:adenylate cyclase